MQGDARDALGGPTGILMSVAGIFMFKLETDLHVRMLAPLGAGLIGDAVFQFFDDFGKTVWVRLQARMR